MERSVVLVMKAPANSSWEMWVHLSNHLRALCEARQVGQSLALYSVFGVP